MKEVVIVSAVRTPMGSFLGSLSSVPATALGTIAIKGAIEKIGIDPKVIDEVYMGNVLQANVGQAPARKAAIDAGIDDKTPCTTVNKVCSSGLKAVMFAVQSIKCGDADVIVAGGMENMSQVPSYYNTRTANKLGDVKMVDGIMRDGLSDCFDQSIMGECGDLCAEEHGFSREDQDEFAKSSYLRSAVAWKEGKFTEEVVPVSVPQRRGEPLLVTEDEEYKRIDFDRIAKLRPAFNKDGSVTAANASTLNDGASALILMSREKAEELGVKPLARVLSYADAARDSKHFTIAPALAVPRAVAKADMNMKDIEYFELNEAFSVVALANTKLMKLDPEKVNVNGGAVSLGHPLGSSGSRILITLMNVLKQNKAQYGAVGICNGGGGASAMVIENL